MARVTIQPIPLNIPIGGALGAFIPAGSVGYDTGSPGGSFTAWGGAQGIQFQNNGLVFVALVNGASASVAQLLVGQKDAGVNLLAATFQTTIAASSPPSWLPPLSPQTFNQPDASAFSGQPAGAIGVSGQGLTCIDFTVTTTLGVRLYQLIPVTP